MTICVVAGSGQTELRESRRKGSLASSTVAGSQSIVGVRAQLSAYQEPAILASALQSTGARWSAQHAEACPLLQGILRCKQKRAPIHEHAFVSAWQEFQSLFGDFQATALRHRLEVLVRNLDSGEGWSDCTVRWWPAPVGGSTLARRGRRQRLGPTLRHVTPAPCRARLQTGGRDVLGLPATRSQIGPQALVQFVVSLQEQLGTWLGITGAA